MKVSEILLGYEEALWPNKLEIIHASQILTHEPQILVPFQLSITTVQNQFDFITKMNMLEGRNEKTPDPKCTYNLYVHTTCNKLQKSGYQNTIVPS